MRVGSGPEAEFLRSAGILSRPLVELAFSGNPATFMAKAHIQAFLDQERQEPGAWALAQGERSFLMNDGHLKEGRAVLVKLHRAIPVPDKDVPLADILEFREKRRAELQRLRAEIDNFYDSVEKSADEKFGLQRCINQIDLACADLLKLSREGSSPFRLADLKVSYELRTGSLIRDATLGHIFGQQFGMATLGALVGGTAGILKISRDFGIGGKHGQNPYWYVYGFHREVFNEPG